MFRRKQVLCLTLVLVVLGLGSALTTLTPQPDATPPGSQAEANPTGRASGTGEAPAWIPLISTLRRVYRYSVVPGGVEDAEELREAIARDPIVEGHYKRVKLERIAQIPLARPKFAYVSYRVRERVFWTRRPVLLHVGEKLLTDGHTVIRARCGNQVAFVPRLPVAQADPIDMEIAGELIPPPKRRIPAILIIPPPERRRFVPIPPIFPPPRRGHPHPRIGAGDPGTGLPWIAVATGIAGFLFLRRRDSKTTRIAAWRS